MIIRTSRPRVLHTLLIGFLLAAAFAIGSVAATTNDADATPSCTIQFPTDPDCLQPVAPSPVCQHPYRAVGSQCVAFNQGSDVLSVIFWRCPIAPFLTSVSANVETARGYSYIHNCSYTPRSNPFIWFTQPSLNLWN